MRDAPAILIPSDPLLAAVMAPGRAPGLDALLTVPEFPRVSDYAGLWAIEERAGAALWNLARQCDLAAHVAAAGTPRLKAEDAAPAAVGKQRVAVVMLTGTLMKAVGSMEAGTSTVAARRALRKAAADPDVDAIMLAVDSPGGTVSGTMELAADVAAAKKQKPVYAFADDLAASAAYWVASQADRVYANNPTALVGSIGTLFVVYDLSEMAAKEGVKVRRYATGPLKGAGVPGAEVTPEQDAHFQALVEDTQKSFDAGVRRGRGLTDAKLAKAKTGGVFLAEDALALGLIDEIASFDKAMSDLAAEVRRRGRESTTRADGPAPIRSATMTETGTPTAVATEPAPTVVHNPADLVSQMRQAAVAEQTRIAGINRHCAAYPELAAQAIGEGWTVLQAENAALREQLKSPGISTTPGGGGPTIFSRNKAVAPGVTADDMASAALCRSFGSPGMEARFKPDVLQAADDHFRAGIGLQQLLMMAAAQNGYHLRAGERVTQGNLRELLKAAFGPAPAGMSASASTLSLPGTLGNTANAELNAGYTEEDQTWQELSRVVPATNFHTRTYYRMLDNMEYEEVGADGKIKEGTLSEESYTASLKTFAKMFALTRRDWINDNLGALADLRPRLGRGSAKKFNNFFWTKMLADHATFFTTARGNYITGATTTLLTDGVGLGLAVKAFRQLKSSTADGAKRVGGRPEILFVPPELEAAARAIYVTTNTGAVKASDANIYPNMFRPVVVPWLSDSAFTGYSTTAWYLFRSAADLPMMVVSFLNGMRSPTVESVDADFDTLGTVFRGYHDFHADQAEYLCGIKSKGAA